MRRVVWIAALVAVVAGGWVAYQRWRAANPGVIDLDSAWARVQRDARAPKAWAALADAQASMDQPEAAEQSYRTALRLGGDRPALLGRLGFLLYGQGRDREALELLRGAQRGGADLPMLEQTVAGLEERLAPPEVVAAVPEAHEQTENQAPPRVCVIPVRRTHQLGTFLVDARVNGEPVTLVVDTGASLTALAAELVDKLGVEVDEERTIHAITATGPAVFPTATVARVELGGERVTDLRVAVCDGCGGRDAGGLLGLDVQAALGLDIQASVLRVADCR